jgi:hypothetical protein
MNYKKWIYSSLDSFLTGFLGTLILQVETLLNTNNVLNPEVWTTSLMMGLFVAGLRGGLKAVREKIGGRNE